MSAPPATPIARRLRVSGKVQGVFYRNWTVATARELQLTGWVRNLSTGEVEVLAIGSPDAVETLIRRCRDGPTRAVVEEIVVSEASVEPFRDFSKQPTV